MKVTNNNWFIYNNRGIAHADHANYRQAIEDYSRAIEIKPNYADAYTNRGVAYAILGNDNPAVSDLKTASQFGNERAKNLLRR